MSRQAIKFIKFTVIWVACNLSIPFWVIGHVHLTVNVYEDLTEIIASMGMNVIVAIGFWLNWKDESKNKAMIRGIDYVTVEVAGIGKNYSHTLEQCNEMLNSFPIFREFETTVLQSRNDGFVDVLLKPKDGDKKKFIKNLKNIGYEHS